MAVTRIPIPDWARTQKHDDRLELSLAAMDLIVRTVNCLEEVGVFTMGDLLNCTPKRLLEIPNLGEKTLETIYATLATLGFHRRPVDEVNRLPARDFALLRRLLVMPSGNGAGAKV